MILEYTKDTRRRLSNQCVHCPFNFQQCLFIYLITFVWLGIFALFIVLFTLVDKLSGNREKKEQKPKRKWGLFGYVKNNWWINLSLRWTDADCFRLLVKLGVLELQRGDDAEPQACTLRGQIILVRFSGVNYLFVDHLKNVELIYFWMFSPSYVKLTYKKQKNSVFWWYF